MQKVTEVYKSIKKEIRQNPLIYILLFLILASAFFLRIYRQNELMLFYFDQGRDALVIWDLWHKGKLFLIGPVTGLEGIFLGPFYYYLIAPFYLLGAGNPLYPAYFLSFLVVLGIGVTYYLGFAFHSRRAGLITAFIASFSYYLVRAGRWLSNPTPIFLTSVLLLWSLWEIARGRSKVWWVVASLLIGISLHFEAASAVFYIPMFLVFAIWQRKNLPDLKIAVYSFLAFFVTLLPQIAFNFRHDNILLNNFKREFLQKEGFSIAFWELLGRRINYFWSVFYGKILPDWPLYTGIFAFLALGGLVERDKKEKTKTAVKLLLIFIGIPMIGYIFYQGNFGNLYDYYMTGYYLPIILLFSLGLSIVWKDWFGKIAVIIFLSLFLFRNGVLTKNYLTAGIDGETHISLGNELQAVNWIFDDAEGKGEFNVDVYVPPVIPHSYDYLFLWQGKERCGEDLCGLKLEERRDLLYTLYEVDPPHPERLEAWLERQKGIGEVLEEEAFGGITVQRRERIKDE